MWLWFDLSLRLAVLGLCVEVALFQRSEEKPEGRTVTGAGVRPVGNFAPPAVIVRRSWQAGQIVDEWEYSIPRGIIYFLYKDIIMYSAAPPNIFKHLECASWASIVILK